MRSWSWTSIPASPWSSHARRFFRPHAARDDETTPVTPLSKETSADAASSFSTARRPPWSPVGRVA